MRTPFLPRPSRDALFTSPLHVIVRDFPETLQEFQSHGVSLEEFGDRSLQDFEDPGPLLDALEDSTAWRPPVIEA
ncbi:MAG: hypothetical protein EA421_09075 [Gemmatimonadales bacterium]|jgi:hypothetical protein|nr:MAG: hypothetical protein EA421_09075 [Gemmatimonadales bacterium]